MAAVFTVMLLEAQFAMTFENERETERRERMQNSLQKRSALFMKRAASIPIVPDKIVLKEVVEIEPALFLEPYRLVLGMDYNSVEYVPLRLSGTSSLVINGRGRGTEEGIIINLLNQIQNNVFTHRTDVYVFDGAKRALSDVKSLGCVKTYSTDLDVLSQTVEEIWQQMEERQKQLYETDDESMRAKMLEKWPLQLFVINGERVIKGITTNISMQGKMNDIIMRFNDCKACVIWCGYPNAKASFLSSSDLEKNIQALNTFLYCDSLSNLKMLDVSLQTQRQLNRPYVSGDAFFHSNEELCHVKLMSLE